MSDFWRGRRVLVTGHTGFKGAWLCRWLELRGADVSGLGLPAVSAESAYVAMGECVHHSHLVDIRDADAVFRAVEAERPAIVFHLAGQALVHRGWSEPAMTYATNVLGSSHLLEAIGKTGGCDAVVVVTSDKVYVPEPTAAPFRERSPLGGRDPYSASKAAVEHVVTAWRRGGHPTAVATGRAGNVVGGGDTAPDRLLPDLRRALQAGVALQLRNPTFTRPWQFVLEPLAGYLALAEYMTVSPSRYPTALNFGPDPSAIATVADVVTTVHRLCGGGNWVTAESSSVEETSDLSLDSSLAREWLGWRPRLSLERSLAWTVDWWRCADQTRDLRRLADSQIEAYEALSA